MQFSLSLPGQYQEFECYWPHVSIKYKEGFWNLQTGADADVVFQLARIFNLQQLTEKIWANPHTEISLHLLPEEEQTTFFESLDDLVEMEMEIPISDLALQKGIQLECWGCHMDIDVFGSGMRLTIPLQKTQCQNNEIQIHPLDADRDAVMIDEHVIGYVWKERDVDSPYSQLSGLVNTTGHPFLFHPVWPALPEIKNNILQEMLEDVFHVKTLDEIGMEFQEDYLGIANSDMNILLAGITHALQELCGEDFEEYLQNKENAEHREELESVEHLLACSLFLGSRTARSIYTKLGADTKMEKRLDSRLTRCLVEGHVKKRLSFLYMSGDERLTRILCLENRSSLFLSNLFLNLADQEEWHNFDGDEVWGWMCWAFDLGAKYQMARVDYKALLHWAEDFDEEPPNIVDYLAKEGFPDYIDGEAFLDEDEEE